MYFRPILVKEQNRINLQIKSDHFGAFLALGSSELTCAWKSTFFILPCNTSFRANNSLHIKGTLITDVLKKNAHDQNGQTVVFNFSFLRDIIFTVS